MPWSNDERNQLFRAFWGAGVAKCPSCQRANVRFSRIAYLGGYTLTATCPRGCSDASMPHTADPDAGSFREWTDAEKEATADQHFDQGTAVCPVDGTRIEVQENPYFGGMILFCHCRRCGQAFQQNLPRK